MVPPVALNVLTVEASVFTVLFKTTTLLFTVVTVASFALALTTVVSDVSSVKLPFAEIAADTVFTNEMSTFVDNAVDKELAKLGLFPRAAAISASVFRLSGAPASSVDIFPSKYETVAFVDNPADRVDTLFFSAVFAVCNEAIDVEMAPDTDATDAVRVETSVLNDVLIAFFVTSNAAIESDIRLATEVTAV